MSEASKIDSRRKSGVCAKHQRTLATAIKRARQIGMVPFDRTHKFVIKQTYQRGPDQRGFDQRGSDQRGSAARTNEDNATSTASAEPDKATEATTTNEETTASAESDKKA